MRYRIKNRQSGIGKTEIIIAVTVVVMVAVVATLLIGQVNKDAGNSQGSQSNDVSRSPVSDERDARAAQALVKEAYTSYLSDSNSANSTSLEAFDTFLASTTPALTERLKVASPALDPIVCAQNLPQSITVDEVTIDPSSKLGTTTVETNFGESSGMVKVTINTVDNKINSITC